MVLHSCQSQQGCLLPPTLFNNVQERLMTDILEEHTGTNCIGHLTITNLQFADYIIGLAGKEEELFSLVQYLDRISTAYGMEINAEKKLMAIKERALRDIKVNDQILEVIASGI